MKNLKVGQTVCLVHTKHKNIEEVKIEAVGRKYLYINKHKSMRTFYLDSMELKINQNSPEYMHYLKIYESKETFLNEQRYKDLINKIHDTFDFYKSRLNELTRDEWIAIGKILKIEEAYQMDRE